MYFFIFYIKFTFSAYTKRRDKTMDDKITYSPNNDKQNYPFSRLQFWLKR